ncbi:hypothetical protein [Arthrobacter sp. A5]|uniref:hypothetical protein n=1 Tax=Arthrobacter sp. A5 TaxID=576926 RepID=UPI003DA90F87
MNPNKSCLEADCERLAIKRERCETHYKAWNRKQPRCRVGGCNSILLAAERKTRGDYCRAHEQLALTLRSPAMQARTLANFRRAIEPDWLYGCWLWTETPNQDGYPMVHAGTVWLAHRFAYVWFYGGHGRRQTLDHLCNRTLCVRPDHMQVVSATTNNRRRDIRTFAPPFTPYFLGSVPSSAKMDAWALENGLPYGNPLWLDAFTQTIPESPAGDSSPRLSSYPTM